MICELLTPEQMMDADRLTAAAGPLDGFRLMQNAGAAVAAEILKRLPKVSRVDVLCGPGNNGGDGYVVAELLHRSGIEVRVWRETSPREGSDAALAAARCPVEPQPLFGFEPDPESLIVDALYGAGLSKPIKSEAARVIAKIAATGARVVSIDLPSGVSGESGAVLGVAVCADLTVTFFRKRPGHLLYPGRAHCGELLVADIDIPARVLGEIDVRCWENAPPLWLGRLPRASASAHKYTRGHAAVFSGGPSSTGAGRLAAIGALRAGAGAVTLLSPAAALQVNAAHLTAIMLKRIDTLDELTAFGRDRRPSAYALGPGFGVGERLREMALSILEKGGANTSLVLDADAITSFAEAPAAVFTAAAAKGAPALVLTPHEGEFGRLFADLAEDVSLSKLDKARKAAARSHGIVVLKGPDTVIAAPDARAVINANGAPWLATAGSGDVLTGIIAGLLAQGMPDFEAACAAVWMHAEAGRRFGAGLIAEDLPGLLPAILAELLRLPAPSAPLGLSGVHMPE